MKGGVLSLIFLEIVRAHTNLYVMKIKQSYLNLSIPHPSSRPTSFVREYKVFLDMFLTNLDHNTFPLNLCSIMIMLVWNNECIWLCCERMLNLYINHPYYYYTYTFLIDYERSRISKMHDWVSNISPLSLSPAPKL